MRSDAKKPDAIQIVVLRQQSLEFIEVRVAGSVEAVNAAVRQSGHFKTSPTFMCGIAGFVDERHAVAAPSAVLARMTDSIVHRGPDDEGAFVDGPLAMGMRRLSIIDLAGGRQPMCNEDGRYTVVFNGEIYNYRELRAELLSRGHRLLTDSDTEVIVHLYEEMQERCVERLRGMFAFAVWDNQRRELFIARDRLGIKPLYFAEFGGGMAFASEIKALLQHPLVDASLDVHGLGDYLSLKYVPAPRTMFEGIASLPPGYFLRWRGGRLETERYWDVTFNVTPEPYDEEACADRLLELLRESVKLRLRSDVPFGAFLSGGVDSSLIVALMSEVLNEPVKTFSVGFDGGSGPDELPYARQVAQQFGCEHHEIVVTARDFVEQAETVVWHLDQPIADQATMATHLVARLASQHVKMVLTGEGGDELFAGYARYVGERYSPWMKAVPTSLRRSLRAALPHLPGGRRPKIALNALSHADEAVRFAEWFPLFNRAAKCRLLSADMRQALGTNAPDGIFRRHLADCTDPQALHRMLYVDTKLWLPDYLLLRGDKLTMANSLEARVPLLDHKVVEFAATLPPDMKLRGRARKYLLKRVAAKFLPDSILRRKKQGFPIPISQWIRGAARPLVRDALSPERIRRRGLFDPRSVETLLTQHESGFADHGDLLWGLVNVELWQQQFCDASSIASGTTGRPAVHSSYAPAMS
ncbi:MAG: asparagine synthase (glutamine-hydrolyzing) [Planctomycetaceae bacterium]|nr:asparagine synthase (glutamine-hydrolyzing) [Planctomycetaceae bacterium]